MDARLRAGVYVHFPYCLAKCPYCDFVSYVPEAPVDHRGYADAILRELDVRAPALAGRRVTSLFFGGGTPSLWDPRELGRVVAGVRGALDVTEDVEVTVECNPTSLDEEKARALHGAGVNRLSIGVQSLDGERLRFLGRLHDVAGAIDTVQGALRSGMPRVSADLIFGLHGQAPEAARDEALRLADLGLSHMSCYQLTIESGTRFGQLARVGRLPLAEDSAVAEAFLAIEEALGGRGLAHYEISNYARPGEEARHNLGYWRGDEYLGLGCGAYGFVRLGEPAENAPQEVRPAAPPRSPAHGIRWRNEVLPDAYVASMRSGPPFGPTGGRDEEALDAETLLRERIMLGLRVEGGLDLDEAARDLRIEGWTPARERACARLAERERVVREGPRVRIPPAAWLWADDTAARLF